MPKKYRCKCCGNNLEPIDSCGFEDQGNYYECYECYECDFYIEEGIIKYGIKNTLNFDIEEVKDEG